ncbi:MAG: glycosyltransferase family 4 protein [Acidobacteria bacterium]|nr:glycosyltransferase family 4 protein [Acidobacteriota bacterium]
MSVLIDCTPLLMRSAGVKNYLYYWCRALGRCDSGGDLELFPFLGDLGGLDHERSPLGLGGTLGRLALVQLLNRTRIPLADPWLGKARLFHCSNQVRYPPRHQKLTATIHDLTSWVLPECHKASTVAADRIFSERVLKRADLLIAPSENTRQDAVRILGLRPESIEVILHGVPEEFFSVSQSDMARAAERYRLPKPYLLFVGSIEPRKNLDRLLDAYAGLRPTLREEFELVLAGPRGWRYHAVAGRIAGGLPGVRHLGYVPEADLPGLTAGAAACVYPSLYEGFGFPVAQAMAAGTPVVTSPAGSLREIAGESALYVDPLSVSSIRAEIERVLCSSHLRDELAAGGRRRAELFRWSRCARLSWDFFRKAQG